jgi:hypothetical protein
MNHDSEARLDIDEVVQEADVFRVAIQGHAAVEERIDLTIADAFGGNTPNELKRLPFRTRLALLVALTQVPKKFTKPLETLAQLRHDFAHGRIDGVPPYRDRKTASAARFGVIEDGVKSRRRQGYGLDGAQCKEYVRIFSPMHSPS